MKKLMQDKRGVFDIIFLLVLLFGVALIGLIVFKLSWGITDEMKNMTEIQESPYAYNATAEFQASQPYIFDGLIFFFFLGMVISLLVAAVRTQFSPVVIGLFIILLILTVFISAGLVNIYRGFADNEDMIDVSNKLTFTNIIFSRYTPLIIMILGALILITMWGKSGSQLQTIT